MKTILKVIALVLFTLILICGVSYLTDKNSFSEWTIKTLKTDTSRIAWAKFDWSNDTLGGKYYEKTAMYIPAKIQGLQYNFSFQFDLGAYTTIYETNAKSLLAKYPALSDKIGRLKNPLQFWDSRYAFKNLTITFGEILANTKNCKIEQNYGEQISFENLTDSSVFCIGTIGADLFQDKILIIDYPDQRFAVCDTLPVFYKIALTNIELDKQGRAILPMKLKSKKYNVLFDNGSSIFPLLVTDDKINNFSTSATTDTIAISSWGTIHNVIGRSLNDSFEIGGQPFSKIKVYTDYRKEARTYIYDAITGNALFWTKTIIIDFKNKKFGVK